ncbi:putative ORfan [Saudi moumouvirus]|nr:putative ORfan [Saudi moumouvirus]
MGNILYSKCQVCFCDFKPKKKFKQTVCQECCLLSRENQLSISRERLELKMQRDNRVPRYYTRPVSGSGFPIGY